MHAQVRSSQPEPRPPLGAQEIRPRSAGNRLVWSLCLRRLGLRVCLGSSSRDPDRLEHDPCRAGPSYNRNWLSGGYSHGPAVIRHHGHVCQCTCHAQIRRPGACRYDSVVGCVGEQSLSQCSWSAAAASAPPGSAGHRQKGFALEPGAQSGFGHYQAQENRTLAWLKSILSFKTVYNTFENRRMHQCRWGGCGHVMALHSMPAEWANGFGSGCAHFWRQSH